jgi:hypothetical protein
MNRRALELTGCLNQTEIGSVHNIRSAPVRELSAQIQEVLDHRNEANSMDLFELKRVIFDAVACEWGVSGPSPSLARMRRGRISERGLQ